MQEFELGCQVRIAEVGSDFDGVIGTVQEIDQRVGQVRVAYEQWFASHTRYTHGWYDFDAAEVLA